MFGLSSYFGDRCDFSPSTLGQSSEREETLQLDVVSMSAYRRVSTVMNRYDLYAGGGFIRYIAIDPAELEASLPRDAMPPWHEMQDSTLFT